MSCRHVQVVVFMTAAQGRGATAVFCTPSHYMCVQHACRYVHYRYTVTHSFSLTVRLRPVLPSALPASDDVWGGT